MKNRGFTLIEILIALSVFAIIATITSTAMYNAFNTRSRVSEQADKLNELQLVIFMLKNDFTQITARSVRSNNMELEPPFVGNPNSLNFTRGGFVNPGGIEKRSTLKRVTILCGNGQLVRRNWLSLDTMTRTSFHDRVLLNRIKECRFTYMNKNLQELNEWRAGALQQNQTPEIFPKAVKLELTLVNQERMDYWLIIPEALYDEI